MNRDASFSSRVFSSALSQLAAYKAPPPRPDAVKLDAMENPYALPDDLRHAWLEHLRQVDFNRYPDADASSLKQALVQRFPMPEGWDVLLGNGSDEIIQMLCLAVARPGAAVMAPDPSFVMYRHLAVACQLRFCPVPLDDNFQLDAEGFVAAIRQERPPLIFIAQPNNPTGNLFDVDAVRSICAAATGLVVIDEAYIAFAGGDSLSIAKEFDNVVLMRTLSKWGLAGLRLGFLQGPAELLAQLDKLRLPYNVNVLTQASVEFALQHAHVFDQQVEILRQQRCVLAETLALMPGTEVFPSAANFLLVRQSSQQAQSVLQALNDADVLIKNLDAGHPALKGCLRPSVGTPEENQRLLEVWQQAVKATA
ncbi:MAG: histidinol-phosphate transaminase [Oceanococcus sp.]